MLTCEALQALKEALSEGRAAGPLSLREFGEMLGGAVGHQAYGTVCHYLVPEHGHQGVA